MIYCAFESLVSSFHKIVYNQETLILTPPPKKEGGATILPVLTESMNLNFFWIFDKKNQFQIRVFVKHFITQPSLNGIFHRIPVK